jgi:hypothetical protein
MSELMSTSAMHAFDHPELPELPDPPSGPSGASREDIEADFEVDGTVDVILKGGYRTVSDLRPILYSPLSSYASSAIFQADDTRSVYNSLTPYYPTRSKYIEQFRNG